jgi:quinol monooxygenase YgiN
MNSKTFIAIYVSVVVPPENKGKFETNLKHVIDAAKDVKGCLKYQWLINPDDKSNYIIYGEFDTQKNFALYRKSQVVEMIGKQLLPLLKDKPRFKHFQAETFEEV